MTGQSRTEAEFEGWLTPAAALKLAPKHWGFQTTVKWIDGRLESGLIKAAARDHRLAKQTAAIGRMGTIAPHLWRGWACLADTDFWDTGDLTLYSYDSTGHGGDLIGQFYDVRFDPQGFESLGQHVSTEPPSELPALPEAIDRSNLPALPETLLVKWAAIFNEANPGASEAAARDAVDAMFPTKRVTRERLRQVLPERRAGRPLKNNNY